MKKSILVLILVVSVTAIVAGCVLQGTKSNDNYLRIHIRADSNLEEAQSVKYAVKDEIVLFLTDKLKGVSSKKEAISIVEKNISEIESIADKVLSSQGFTYSAKASVRQEEFPARSYEGLLLPEDVYDALIVELGSGKGDNWWCVVFPPLCFVSTDSEAEYKSFIYEWYKKLTEKE